MTEKTALRLFGEFLEALGYRNVVEATLSANWRRSNAVVFLDVTQVICGEKDTPILDEFTKQLRYRTVNIEFDSEK